MYSDIVTSVKNPIVKYVKKLLASSKDRRSEGLAVAEGVHLAQSLLSAGIAPQIVIYAESSIKNPEVKALTPKLDIAGVSTLIVKDSLFESLSDIHAAVGLLVVFSPTVAKPAEQLPPQSLLLEDIQDPGNLGTILRTAAAAGITSVYVSPGSASVWSPKVLRAGMGAQFSLSVHESVDLAQIIERSDTTVIATDLSATDSLYDVTLDEATTWLFGNEGQGVSEQLLSLCSQRVTIPQADSTVESLNVSAAVAVCLFEQRRQMSQR